MQEWILTLLGTVDLRLAVVISILLQVVIAILGIVPSIFITAANVAVFGVVNGFVLSTVGEVFGAQVTFYLYRYGFKQPLQKRINNRWFERLFNHRQNIGYAIILQGRLIPFIPSGLVTFYASVSSIGGLPFFIASTLGKLPAMLLEVLVAYGVLQLDAMYLVICLIVFVFGIFLWTIMKRKSA